MPELPEVETIRQDLRQKILHKKMSSVEIIGRKVARGQAHDIMKIASGKVFKEIDRVGKLLIFEIGTTDVLFLLVHLKMTGQLIYIDDGVAIGGGHSFKTLNKNLPDKHTQMIFKFEGGATLFFNDMRRFGYVALATPVEKEKIVARFGIEPLTPQFTAEKFVSLFKKRKTSVKALLLNQALIAGIGNIYADEMCHDAGILPDRPAHSLQTKELLKLYDSAKRVLAKAVAHRGTTFNNYVDSDGNKGNFLSFLKVYGRAGLLCLTCKEEVIRKKRVAGRGTHFCTRCQK